jgi:hypothetical protein
MAPLFAPNEVRTKNHAVNIRMKNGQNPSYLIEDFQYDEQFLILDLKNGNTLYINILEVESVEEISE